MADAAVCTTLAALLDRWREGSAACMEAWPEYGERDITAEPPAHATFVFLGGLPHSGLGLVEQLILSHRNATGLRPDLTQFEEAPHACRYVRYSAQGTRCSAPDNHGLYLTRAFDRVQPINRYNRSAPDRPRSERCSQPWMAVAELDSAGLQFAANGLNMIWNQSYPPVMDHSRVRRTLWKDWSPFWEQNAHTFVEKDVPTLMRAPGSACSTT